jgi:putative redox protein
MAEIMTAVAKLDADMRFEGEAASGHHVLLDASGAAGGHNAGFRPMELLLVGLAGCTGMDVIALLRKQRQEVTGYEVHVQGVRAASDPQVFEDITIEHIITGHHLRREAVRRAIALSEHRYCAAAVMLGEVAQLRHMYCIVQVEMPDVPEQVPA